MKSAHTAREKEPVGIVISHSAPLEAPTVFSAYVWGPAPEEVPPKAA